MKKIYILLSLLLFSAVVLNSAIIIVPDDYFDIQMAIVAAGDGDTIVLRPGNYAANSLSWSNKHLTIRALQLNDPESYKLYGSENCFMLSGLSITNEDKILGITIEDYHAQSNWAQCGVAFNISAGASPYVEGCIIRYNSSYYLGNEQFPSNSRGIAVFCDGDAVFKNCYFYCNEGFRMIGGAALACKGNVKINDCIFENNHFIEDFCPLPYIYHDSECRNGSAILVMAAQSDEDCIEITNCKFILNDSGPGESCIFIENSTNFSTNNVEVNNCTFDQNTGNNVIEIDDALICIIKNNCFMNNESTYCVRKNQLTSSPVSYCLSYQSGNLGNFTGCINCLENTAPQLDTNYKPLWNATTKSVCIDAGDPSILDADGTPSDIGAVSAVDHRYDEVDLPSLLVDSGWKWLSFPSLDVVLNNADLIENALYSILQPPTSADLDYMLASDYSVCKLNNNWTNDTEQLDRTEGYKLHMNAATTLDVPGFKVPDNTTIVLGGGDTENWVGYWLDETQSVQDAFGSYWDGGNIYSVKHQKWSAYRSHGEWKFKVSAGYENPTLSYGDMVEIKCTTGISNFGWDNSTPEDRTVTYAEPTAFNYEEQADYLPLFIELDGDDMPQEIGAFVGDTCIGAAVVETDEVQINAYVGSAPAGNIELQFSYGGRAADRRISQFNCVELSDPHHVFTDLPSRSGGDAYFINLRDGQAPTSGITTLAAQNYPNPFNPETTISYSLPQDGPVCVKVFNSRGQLVTTLVDGEQPSGVYNVTWKGTDAAGNSVSSGIYFYRVTAGNTSINRKMVLLK